MKFFDAHIHLSDPVYTDFLPQIINTYKSLNMFACSVTTNIETTKKSLTQFSNLKNSISQFVGIHPEFSQSENIQDFIDIVEQNVQAIDGIGEIGLDRTYTKIGIDYKIQQEMFYQMLSIAERLCKPVSIHSRSSLDDILDILPSYSIPSTLLHWFAGNKKQLKKAEDMGLYISFGPVLVYSEDKKSLLKRADLGKVLVETDGPVRYSRCFENLPALSSSFLVSILHTISQTLNMPFNEISERIWSNSQKFLMKEVI